jgi:HK97 family phage portal protein
MGLLTQIFDRQERSLENPSTPLSAPDDWLYDALGAVRASSGVNVNRETALTYAAWWRGVNLISRDVAKVPAFVYRRGKIGKKHDYDHPAYYLLRRQPNREMTPFHFKQMMQSHVLAEGNGYAYIDRAGDGTPLELVPLQPTRTYPVRSNGVMSYITELKTGEPRKIAPEDMLHIKGLSFDGLVGYNVITKARESLGLGMAFDTFGSVVFRNGTSAGVVLKHPGRLSPEAKENLRESWERMHAGLENAHKTAILEEGMAADKLGLSPKDAQLLDERMFQKEEIALWFGLPPHKLGANITTSYGSLEQENQDYLDSALDPWLVNWEEELDAKLLTERQKQRDTHTIEFHRKSLIRANMSERGAYYNLGLQGGWLNRDEVRAEEGYNPIPDGEGRKFFVPLNMGPQGGGAETDDETAATQQTPGNLLEVPDIRQPDHFSCGACAAMCVGQYFGVGPASLEEWKAALGTDVQQSTKPMEIVRYLSELGLVVTAAHNMTLDDLRRFWAAGQPVICPVQDYGPFLPGAATFDYGHYLTVIGVSLGYVFAQDSSADNALEGEGSDAAPGRIMVAEQTWLDNWHDKDSDENQYVCFGIAVGRELLPEGGEEDEDEETEDDEAEGKPGDKIKPTKQSDTNTTDATSPDVPITSDSPARFLADVYRRMSKRIGLRARRWAKDPKAFMGWLDRLGEENQAALRSAFAPAQNGAALADTFLARLHEDLLDLSGRCTAKELAAEVDRYFADKEK